MPSVTPVSDCNVVLALKTIDNGEQCSSIKKSVKQSDSYSSADKTLNKVISKG